MEEFTREDFEKLASVKNDFCISIYIATHRAGVEVNEGQDQISFKNQIQKIQLELEKRNHRNLSAFIKPLYDLLDDSGFWREQSDGLAVFYNDQIFRFFRVPVSFRENSFLSSVFILTPMLPLLIEEDEFFTLSLSQNKIKLFRNTTFSYEEVGISGLVPENAEEIFSFYEFKKRVKGKNMNPETSAGIGNSIFRGHNPDDDEDKYIAEYLRQVNDGIMEILKNKKSPLVIAATESMYSIYQSVNTYQHLYKDFVPGNPDRYNEQELHDKAYDLVKSKLGLPRKNDLEKYPAWAGTGKTSYDLNVILNAAFDGRVESLFLEEGSHVWGKYDIQTRQVEIHTKKQENDICLYNLAAAKTIENSGKAYEVTAEEMPEKNFQTSLAAVFRY